MAMVAPPFRCGARKHSTGNFSQRQALVGAIGTGGNLRLESKGVFTQSVAFAADRFSRHLTTPEKVAANASSPLRLLAAQ
jgi:hypothetical protein